MSKETESSNLGDYLQQEFTLQDRDFYFELEDYEFFHSPYSLDPDKEDARFIGREKELARLRLILENSKTKSGAYLVTGFRGMGKTSLVRKAIFEVNQMSTSGTFHMNKYVPIEISLAQDDIEEIDVFRLIARHLLHEIEQIKGRIEDGEEMPASIKHFEDEVNQLKQLHQTAQEINDRISAEIEIEVIKRKDWQGEVKAMGAGLGVKSPSSGDSRSKRHPVAGPKELEWFLITLLAEIEKYRTRVEKHKEVIDNYYKALDKYRGEIQAYKKDLDQEHIHTPPKLVDYVRDKNSHLHDLLKMEEKIEEEQEEFCRLQIPDFIFVFDELDKIEPSTKGHLADKESEDPYFERPSRGGEPERLRNRRETIERLLANLKNFLNTARAKFIFIGGREMYDASLADIADRDSFYSSIFHDIIYVESFLKNGTDRQASGLSRMTEMYLCKILLPPSYLREKGLVQKEEELAQKEEAFSASVVQPRKKPVKLCYPAEEVYSLRTYHEYLCDRFLDNEGKLLLKKGEEAPFRGPFSAFPNTNKLSNAKQKAVAYHGMRKLNRAIFLLQNFVIFLTYRSSGTPKKLTSLVEDYIVSDVPNSEIAKKHFIFGYVGQVDGSSASRLYLRFTQVDQYVISIHSAIYRPYVITQSRHKKHWGDKLLFSTSYIIDHLFKFHPFGFSWETLELIPEIISINKAPHLRAFVKELLHHYSQTYVRGCIGGLHHYKFYNKPSNEIKYISRINELSSAAFNFTLDESLMIKRYYHKKLKQLQKSYEGYQPYEKSTRHVEAIGLVQEVLGDLHFYDKEYDDSIAEYSASIQHIQSAPVEKWTEPEMIFYVEMKLKLGFTLEKIQAYQRAHGTYIELIHKIEEYFQCHDKKRREYFSELNISKLNIDHFGFRSYWLITQTYLALLGVYEKMHQDGITDKNILKLEHDYLSLLGFTREDLHGSIPRETATRRNASKNQSEQKSIRLYSNAEGVMDWPFSIISNYLHNQGGILFYKNKNHLHLIRRLSDYDYRFGLSKKHLRSLQFQDISDHYREYLNSLHTGEDVDYNPSISAYVSYREGLRWLISRYGLEANSVYRYLDNEAEGGAKGLFGDRFFQNDGHVKNTYLRDVLLLLSDQFSRLPSAAELKNIGNILTKMGDCLLTFLSRDTNQPPKKINLIRIFSHEDVHDQKNRDHQSQGKNSLIRNLAEVYVDLDVKIEDGRASSTFYSLDLVFFTYRLAAQFYRRAGENFSYAFQYKKALHVLVDYFSTQKKPIDFWGSSQEKAGEINSDSVFYDLWNMKFTDFLKEKLAVPIFKAVTWEANVSNRPQILKYKDIFRLQREMMPENRQQLYPNVSTGVEVWEVILLISDIQLSYKKLQEKLHEKKEPSSEDCDVEQGMEVSLSHDYIDLNKLELDFKLSYSRYAPFISTRSKFLRMMELRYKTDLNWYYFNKFGWDEIFKNLYMIQRAGWTDGEIKDDGFNPKDKYFLRDSAQIGKWLKDVLNIDPPLGTLDEYRVAFGGHRISELLQNTDVENAHVEILEFLIADSIYNLSELTHILNVYEETYMAKYSYLAFSHKKLASWCQFYRVWLRIQMGVDSDKKIHSRLEELLGRDSLYFLEPRYHRELAISYFYSTIQLHSEGRAYQNEKREMFLLEDDFNDNLYHFCAAMERYKINTGYIRYNINQLKILVEGTYEGGKFEGGSKLYLYDTYLGEDWYGEDFKDLEI